MKLETNMSDSAILSQLGRALAQRRIEMGLTQAELARRAGVGKRTLERMESGSSCQSSILVRILRALDALDFLSRISATEGPSPLDLLKRRGKTRKRVSSKRGSDPDAEAKEGGGWTWGDEV